MIKVNKLNGLIAEQGKTRAQVSEAIGITPKTFSQKMKKGVFGSDEIEKMIDFLHISDPLSIFFAKE